MSAAVATPPVEAELPEVKGGMVKKILIVVVALAVVGGAGWWFFLKPGPSGPQPGAVSPLESIQVNLADGHYLRLGLALQLTTAAKEVDGSKALDAAIEVFSGLPAATVDKKSAREKLRGELEKQLEQRYDGEVMDVYFTEFVTQ